MRWLCKLFNRMLEFECARDWSTHLDMIKSFIMHCSDDKELTDVSVDEIIKIAHSGLS